MNPRPSAAYSNSPAPAQGHLSVDWAQHPDEPVARISLAIAPLGRASALLEVQASGAGRKPGREPEQTEREPEGKRKRKCRVRVPYANQ